MNSSEVINTLKVGFTDELSSLEVKAEALKGKIEQVESLEKLVQAEIKAANEAGFEEGLKQAGQAGGEDKIYSDAEVNQIIADTKAPLEAKIAELEVSVAALNEQLAGVPDLVSNAVAEGQAALKAELKAKFEEQQAQESATEQSFGALLS